MGWLKTATMATFVILAALAGAQQPVATINGVPPPFTFTGGGVSQTGQTFTFAGGGSGTVTSVALVGSNTFFSSTAGTAVTTSGTLNMDAQLVAQAANCFFAGPTTGAAATPSCRALVSGDFPSSLTFQSPIFVTPALGTPASGVITNLTGTCTACTANAAASATTATTATNLAGGGVGSLPYQSAAGTTAFIASPTTSGHFFVPSWQPSGSAIAPVSLDLATYLASPAAIGGTTAAAGTFSSLVSNTTLLTGGASGLRLSSVGANVLDTQNGGNVAIGNGLLPVNNSETNGQAATSWKTTFSAGYFAGGTPFTVSGCGTAGSITGGGSVGSFTVGTGATNCTFTVTLNGATGVTAPHGWVANADDTTANIHCVNSTTVSTTTVVFVCTGTIATSDLIKFSAMGY